MSSVGSLLHMLLWDGSLETDINMQHYATGRTDPEQEEDAGSDFKSQRYTSCCHNPDVWSDSAHNVPYTPLVLQNYNRFHDPCH